MVLKPPLVMRCLSLVTLVAVLLLANEARAQSLNERLITEDANSLMEAARKDGNVVRGAILFHQGNINCAKCHRPTAEADRIGPDLSKLDPDVTDAFLVESILEPSKTIKKGFETVTALTLDGQIIHGLVVTQDSEKIVLRDSASVDRLITIRRQDLEEIRPGTKSSMPDDLANELRNRQQFLDLMRYVIEVKERGPTGDEGAPSAFDRRQLSPELKGLVLIHEMNCVACHESKTVESHLTAKQAPDLRWSSKWLNPHYVAQYIADPQGVKPGTTMPNLLDDLNETSRNESAEAITHYLASTAENQFDTKPIDVEAVPRGAELFHTVGCVACHSPRNDMALEKPLADSIPLGDLTNKYNVAGLVVFLENPHEVRSSGRMPSMNLTHWEARDIAEYLLQQSSEALPPFTVDSNLVQQGQALFTQLECFRCHSDWDNRDPQPASHLTLGKLRPGRGCLSDKTGTWPKFQLDEREKKFIQAALNSHPLELTDEQQITITLESFNCTACHERNNFGGVTAVRNPLFKTTNLNLGDQGRIPPTLTGVGTKLRPKWMRDVLVNGRVIRPYMKTRMPQFGEKNVGHLVELFQRTDMLSDTRTATFDDQKEMRKLGLEIAGNKGLNCVACHTYKYKLSDTMPAVDLTEMAERLKKDWFYQYMLDPQKFSPNTVMPSFWPGGVAIRKDIAGNPAFQVEALWQYLIDGRQAGVPRGVVREPLEIVVKDEAQMLRRRYPGIGKRGIGVGYPGGINLAFDAEQMRLAMIWKGKFVDPAGVWTGQGSGNVRPLGKTINLALGPELDDAANPWVVDAGRPPSHQFKGYFVDEVRRPTFMYRFEDVAIEDYFSTVVDDAADQTHLRRQITLSSTNGRDKLCFRVASSEYISDEGNDVFSIDKRFKVSLISDHKVQIVDVVDGQQLQISLNVEAGKEQNLILEYCWE